MTLLCIVAFVWHLWLVLPDIIHKAYYSDI